MHSKNIRYGTHKTKTKSKKPAKFVSKLVWQLLICTSVFLVCLPISKTQTGIRAYISKTLTVSSNVQQAKIHFNEMCVRLTNKYPVLSDNVMWNGFMDFIKEDNEVIQPEQTEQPEPKPVDEALDLVAKAAPQEFIYPENVNMIMPLNGKVTSPFGLREHPVSGQDASHYGVDIAGSRGDAVVTTAPGRVIEVKVHDIYGNCILIQHTERIKSFYAHLDEVYVAEGDIVAESAVIGAVGSTGVATGPHLHFGVRIDDEPTDPEKYIKMEHR
ncbi:MAG: M23 family metallopeptidase [Clostridia bacterium]|nr:M23 family metallopeptidase [Clostridia bacterium]